MTVRSVGARGGQSCGRSHAALASANSERSAGSLSTARACGSGVEPVGLVRAGTVVSSASHIGWMQRWVASSREGGGTAKVFWNASRIAEGRDDGSPPSLKPDWSRGRTRFGCASSPGSQRFHGCLDFPMGAHSELAGRAPRSRAIASASRRRPERKLSIFWSPRRGEAALRSRSRSRTTRPPFSRKAWRSSS